MLNILFLKKIREFFYIEDEMIFQILKKKHGITVNIYIAGKKPCNMTVRY